MYPQLLIINEIRDDRVRSFNRYYENLKGLSCIELPYVPSDIEHNGHMFYIKVKDLDERVRLQRFLRENGVESVFHYIPLHSSDEGLRVGRFAGEDKYTTKESERLLRLPMYYKLTAEDIDYVCDKIKEFYK